MNKDEQLNEIEEEIKKYSKIAEIGKTEGGKEFIDEIGKDIVYAIDEIRVKHRTAPHFELVSIIAKLSVLLNIYRKLIGAEKKSKQAKKEYENRLKELLAIV